MEKSGPQQGRTTGTEPERTGRRPGLPGRGDVCNHGRRRRKRVVDAMVGASVFVESRLRKKDIENVKINYGHDLYNKRCTIDTLKDYITVKYIFEN